MDRQESLLNRAAYSFYWRVVNPLSPAYARCVYNDVEVNRTIKYCHLPFEPGSEYRPSGAQNIPDYEFALCEGLSRSVNPSDHVVIVGGGLGVTAVHAARMAGAKGQVTVYEASESRFSDLETAIRLNHVDDQVKTVRGVVGTDVKVYGEEASTRIPPSGLPACDVLELDCEGAEMMILKEMNILPRILLVETHGFRGAPTTDVEDLLRGRGYEVENIGVAEPRLQSVCEDRDIYVLVAEKC